MKTTDKMARECIGDFFVSGTSLFTCSRFPEDTLRSAVYEVFRIVDRKPLFIDDHINRFRQSINLSYKTNPLSVEELFTSINLLIESNPIAIGNIKLLWWENGYGRYELLAYFIAHQYPDAQQYRDGVKTMTLSAIRSNPNAKVFDLQLRKQTDRIKQEQSVYEVLLLNHESCITEGSRSNVFFIWDNEIRTPYERDVLGGVTRMHVIKVIKGLGLSFREQEVQLQQALLADAAFLTGTSRKVLPIQSINNVLFTASHPMLRRVMAAFNEEIYRYLGTYPG